MIYGLAAALGWGLSDVWAAISGRRVGSGRTLVIAQLAALIAICALVLLARPDLDRIPSVAAWLVVNAFVSAAAFAALYRGLQLGPIAVVSPVLASYAVVPVLLSVALLGEALDALAATGVAVTIIGAVLVSTDVRAIRAGQRSSLPGLPWAIASTVLFGVATYVTGWAAQRAGFLPSLWFGRITQMAVILLAAAIVWWRARSRDEDPHALTRSAIRLAAAVGVVELVGTLAYARGAEVGLVSIVTAASATYPLLPVIGGVHLFQERPAPSQYAGVTLVVVGLAALGFAA